MIYAFQNIPFLNFIFTDFFHLTFYVFIIFISFYLKFISKNLFYFLLILSPTPFIFNNFIFLKYFPDTKDYLETLLAHRNYIDLNYNYIGDNKVLRFSYLLSFFPIPFVFSKISIGYLSKFIYLLLAIYLFNKNRSNNFLLFLILLNPEIIMYSSVGLKETLSIYLMVVSLISYNSRNYVFMLIFLIPLYFIKFQCFYFIAFFIFVHQFLTIININNNLIIKLFIIIFLVIISTLTLFIINNNLINEYVSYLDFICRKLNYNSETCYKDFRELVFHFDDGFLNFIFTPFLREKLSIMTLMQFISSSYYTLLILFLIYFSNHSIEVKITSIIYILVIGLFLGTVFNNDGLLTRQKFSTFYPILCLLFVKSNFNQIPFLYDFLTKSKLINLEYKK